MQPYEIKTHRIGRRRYCYTDEGTGKAVVLLHGHLIAKNQWDPQIPALTQAGYRVICPHRAGMGNSDICEHMSDAADADDTFALLNALGVEKCVAVGHSAGNAHARQMFLSRPSRVEAAVFIDGLYYLSGKASRLGTERYSPEVRALYKKNKAILIAHDLPWYYPSEFNVQLLKDWVEWNREHPGLKDKLKRRDDPENCPIPSGKYCKIPLLVFASGWGKIRPDDPEAAELRERLPAENAELVVATECGHYVQLEQPGIVNKKLLEFLGSLQ